MAGNVGIVMKHFKETEFGGAVEPQFANMMDTAREIAKTPFVINSGHRRPDVNVAVGGVKSSAHLKLPVCAADIRCTTSLQRSRIVRGLLLAGAKRIGIGKTFVHCDNDKQKPSPRIWLYAP